MASSWRGFVDVALDHHRPDHERAAAQNALVHLMQQENLSIREIIENMDKYLSTTDSEIRSRATIFLSAIVAEVPLEKHAIVSLVSFFIARLSDAAGCHGALQGCIALLKRRNGVSNKDALRILSAARLPFTQALPQQDRILCFELLDVLFERYSSALATLEAGTLVWEVSQAIAGEKDPRCLLLAFRLVEHVGKLFPDLSEEGAELFDTISCYFPISYNQRPTDEITKEDLLLSLEKAFTASPSFSPQCIAFLFEKLSSPVKDARLQSLRFLGSCTSAYAAKIVDEAAPVIWMALKDELFPILSLTFEMPTDPDVFSAATDCLSRCIRAFQRCDERTGGIILRSLLNDEICNDLVRYLGQGGNLVTKDRLKATGQVLEAAVLSSQLSCGIVSAVILPAFLSSPVLADPDVLEILVSILEAMRKLALTSSAGDREWLTPLYSSAKQLLQTFSTGVSLAKEVKNDTWLRISVSGLQCLATFPGYLSSLPEAEAYGYVAKLIEIALAKEEYESCWVQAVDSVGSACQAMHRPGELRLYKTIVQNVVQGAVSGSSDIESRVFLLTTISEASLSARDVLVGELQRYISLDAQSCILADGATSSSSTTLVILQSLSRVFQLNSGESGSPAALEMALKLWSSFEMLPMDTELPEESLNSLVELVQAAVSRCDLAGQEAVLMKAYSIFSKRCLEVTCPDACSAALFSAVVVAVRPEFPILETPEMVQLLLKFSVEAEAASIRQHVTEGLASIVNKWCTTTLNLEKVVQHIQEELSAIWSNSSHSCRAITILAWVAKALAMRGDSGVAHSVGSLLRILQNDNDASHEDYDSVRRAAAKGLGVIVEDSRALSREYFATIRPLYKQRYLNSLLEPLQLALRDSKSTVSRSWLLRGFGHVIVAVPPPALLCEAKRVLPLLLEVLPSLVDDSDLLLGNLLVLSSFLLHNKNDIVIDHVSSIVNCLTQLTHYSRSRVVRQTAIQCLGALVVLPYISIYPCTKQILKTLHRALDDPRRLVRSEAARCYQAWNTLSSSKSS